MDPELISLTLATLTCARAYLYLLKQKKKRKKLRVTPCPQRKYKIESEIHPDDDPVKKKKRRLWVKPWLQRKNRSVFVQLIQEMRLDDDPVFYDFHGMNKENFDKLLSLVSPFIQKENTKLRDSIPSAQRLSVTLRYLATGEARRSLALQYRISHCSITRIIPEVCNAVHLVLKDDYLKLPNTSDEWQLVAGDFSSNWNFPMCIGAIDGKRFLVQSQNTGPEYCEYKGYHGIIMVALVDANYKFLYVAAEAQGQANAAGFWDHCKLKEYLDKNMLHFPPAAALPSVKEEVPYVILGDDAFPLEDYLMKPYPGQNLSVDKKIFNYRLSCARRVSENAFRILSGKFRVFQRPIQATPANAQSTIFAAVVLHNFLRIHSRVPLQQELLERENIDSGVSLPHKKVPGIEKLEDISRKLSSNAETVRDSFKTYFNGEGKISWQDDVALLE
ncbi:protein ALP1-like [Penaeus chinensis]|uniref:protein ALP1-like n=1 Tax=Penaeus chinensis TaxID=139456 RepID=UPI001FB7E057|nr:protein ALP1-like [Penaeus chinensis]